MIKLGRGRHSSIWAGVRPFFCQTRSLSISKPLKSATYLRGIDTEELFRYSSGRWLINEKHQLAQRYVKFDVDELCQRAASLFGPSTSCSSIVKMEGGFNKALLLTMDDGSEAIAKLPCPNAGPSHYTTASEVATLELLQSLLSVRVPKVLAWSSNPTNPVGAEYVILEKMHGVPLAQKWGFMSDLERYKLIEGVVGIEKELASIRFPAYGCLYLRESLPPGSPRIPLDSKLDPSERFCIGPTCARSSWLDATRRDWENGPWTTLSAYATAKAQRAIFRIRCDQSYRESQTADEQIQLLEDTVKFIPILSSHPTIARSSSSVLWHTDLNAGNIFVSTDNPTVIEGVIDWQSSQVAPLLLQCRVPAFLDAPENYIKGGQVPKLPEDFEQLDPVQQQRATWERDLARRWKAYEAYTCIRNRDVYNALVLDRRLWEPLNRCGGWSNDSIVPLRGSLIRLARDWVSLGLSGDCPLAFTHAQLAKHDEESLKYKDMMRVRSIAKEQLDTDDEGWVSLPEWESVVAANRELLNMFIETMADEISREEALKMWPFYDETTSME